jgi:hypothetical protein
VSRKCAPSTSPESPSNEHEKDPLYYETATTLPVE